MGLCIERDGKKMCWRLVAGTQRRLEYRVWSVREGGAEILSQLGSWVLSLGACRGWVHSGVGQLMLPPELCLNSPALAPRWCCRILMAVEEGPLTTVWPLPQPCPQGKSSSAKINTQHCAIMSSYSYIALGILGITELARVQNKLL